MSYLQVVKSCFQFCLLTVAHQEGENVFDVVRDQLATVLKHQHIRNVNFRSKCRKNKQVVHC